MSDLQSLIKKLQVNNNTTESYVYYDSTNGKIHKISGKNIPDEDYSVIAIPNEEVKPILTGEKRTDEFIIFYDLSSKQVRLKEVAYEDNHKTASTMCYQLPVIKNNYDGHFALEHVYEGVDVYYWNIDHNYLKDQCVWYNNNVYKLTSDISAGNDFVLSEHSIFVEDVVLSDIPTQTHTAQHLTMTPEYVGVHVDVWYDELPHLAGQHVWINRTVYKLLKDQKENTEFSVDNAELIVSNVDLYADENASLETKEDVSDGMIILKNNELYSVGYKAQEFTKDKSSILFYSTNNTLLYYNNKNCIEVVLDTVDKDTSYKDISLDLTATPDLKNGQTVLSGKNLYIVSLEKEYDVIVQQNTISKCWNVVLNPYTKKFLLTSGYNPKETLYFSVTSKYDPNVLYRSLEFSVSDLLSDINSIIPFKFTAEEDLNNVSIYTAKYFENYAHEII